MCTHLSTGEWGGTGTQYALPSALTASLIWGHVASDPQHSTVGGKQVEGTRALLSSPSHPQGGQTCRVNPKATACENNDEGMQSPQRSVCAHSAAFVPTAQHACPQRSMHAHSTACIPSRNHGCPGAGAAACQHSPSTPTKHGKKISDKELLTWILSGFYMEP